MPGIDLNLTLPSLSENMAVNIARIATALSAIEDDLAGLITSSEININAALSFNGAAATNLGSVQLVAGNAPTAAGSIYYSGGEFYVIDSTGVIQLTQLGALKVTGAGGIIGDYGNGAESVYYDNASQEFRFTSSTGVWADLVADDVVLMGANGSVRLGTAAGITSARSFLFNTLPAAGIRLLAYNASGSTVEDASTVTLGGNYTFAEIVTVGSLVVAVGSATVAGNVVATGNVTGANLTATADYKHTYQKSRVVPVQWGFKFDGQWQNYSSGTQVTTLGSPTAEFRIPGGLVQGDRPKVVKVRYTKINASQMVVAVYQGGVHVQTETTTASGTGTVTVTIATPLALAAETDLEIRVTFNAVNDFAYNPFVYWDHP